MRKRIQGLRRDVVQQLRKSCPQRDFGFIESQRGMFSYLGITVEQVRELQSRHHVYMTDDSRINIAGLAAGKPGVLRASGCEGVARRDETSRGRRAHRRDNNGGRRIDRRAV